MAVSLRPGATINTVIRDSATGAPVPNACPATMSGTAMVLPDGSPYCSDDQGNVHIGPLEAGTYRAGTVTGTVTDTSGTPQANAAVTNSAIEPGPGPIGRIASTDAAGRYTLTGLGPYAWPLMVIAANRVDRVRAAGLHRRPAPVRTQAAS